MSRDVAFKAVDMAMKDSNSTGLLFYGGEPLLERQLIYDIVDYTQAIKKKTNHTFHYKMTTNGVLLDEEFLKFAEKINLTIGFSCDGIVQDDCRLFPDGKGSLAVVGEKIPLLLKYQPYAVGMSVVDPSTVHRASEMVKWLFDKSFRYITVGVNYCRTAPWTIEKLEILEQEYKKIAEMYIAWTKSEEKFYISSFDMKILSHLKGEKYNSDRSKMGVNQPSIAPNGKIYSASRYLDDEAFQIGDVSSGIDTKKQKILTENGAIPSKICQKCAIKHRCNYAYDNMTFNGENYVPDVSAVQCVHEQKITPIADYVAETLYKDDSAMFIHKHYNDLYPIMSLVEDKAQ